MSPGEALTDPVAPTHPQQRRPPDKEGETSRIARCPRSRHGRTVAHLLGREYEPSRAKPGPKGRRKPGESRARPKPAVRKPLRPSELQAEPADAPTAVPSERARRRASAALAAAPRRVRGDRAGRVRGYAGRTGEGRSGSSPGRSSSASSRGGRPSGTRDRTQSDSQLRLPVDHPEEPVEVAHPAVEGDERRPPCRRRERWGRQAEDRNATTRPAATGAGPTVGPRRPPPLEAPPSPTTTPAPAQRDDTFEEERSPCRPKTKQWGNVARTRCT